MPAATATDTWIFPSAFNNPFTTSVTPSNSDDTNHVEKHKNVYDGHIASFVFLVAGLEKILRDNRQILFDSNTSFKYPRIPLGSGHSFIVERAECESRSSIGLQTNKWGKFVALKHVRRIEDAAESTNWKQVLLEIRALLHKPIRYHPNIVRLLGLGWGAAQGTRSNLPVLVLEFSKIGSLVHLQMNEEPLMFSVKKKLCHDVSKGLSILHACGIAHGDLKHENVLIFANNDEAADIIYTAKLADFGGSVMDLENGGSLHMGTPWYCAPEAQHKLDAEELKRTDVYSFGLLVWRVILDGKHPFEDPRFSDMTDEQIENVKRFDQLLPMAKERVRAITPALEEDDIATVEYVFEHTIQAVSQDRSLRHAMAALQVGTLPEIHDLIVDIDKKNEADRVMALNEVPGSHGITKDSLGIYMAQLSNGDYDFQNEGPGHRPKLSSPDPAEFLFEPQRLKSMLDWELQVAIIDDLKNAAVATSGVSTTQISGVVASFYLFQSNMHEFGVKFDPERACHWLREAALSDDDCQENYLAQAWCWRVHQVLGITLDVDISTLRNWMLLSIMRGHRQCISESRKISALITDTDEQKAWKEGITNYANILNTFTGGVGMPYFFSRKLRREYNLQDLNDLDRDIQMEFSFRNVDSLDKIFVNHRGDGLLHMAASLGNLTALKHLLDKYNPDINCANQAKYETPLLCACRGGHFHCAVLLLDRGAEPDGSQYAEETPLYWLCAFSENHIPIIAEKLVAAGATLCTVGSRRNFRLRTQNAWADSDNLFSLPVSPLSRSVMMQSVPAVTTLLALGADALEDYSSFSSMCPVVLAAVLTLPRILEVILQYLDEKGTETTRLITDMEMLQIALDQTAAAVDLTSSYSRIARCGVDYKRAMFETLEILHLRDEKTKRWRNEGSENRARAANTVMARLVSLGRVDIVTSLLQLGHSVHGKPDACPIIEAVKLNHDVMFRLLIGHGADVSMKVSAADGIQQSLLQIFAERPSQSPPGLFIPEYLLKMGVAVDPLPDGSRPAFASAVKNQDFELADLLLRHGADIDFCYPYREGASWTTVFGDLIRNPTYKNVESIKYLLRIDDRLKPAILALPLALVTTDDEGSPKSIFPLPSFIVDKQNNLSILHYAATSVPGTNLEAQAMGQMVRFILSEKSFSDVEVINLCHPDVGTPLWIATLHCNLEVVEALLEKHAVTSTPFRGVTPLTLAMTMVTNTDSWHKPGMDELAKKKISKRYTLITELLRSAQ